MSDIIMKRKYKQRWSIFQLTSTKRKITSHLNWLTTKNVGNHVKFELNNYGFDISTDCRWFRFKTQTGLQLNLVFITIGLNYHIEKNGTSAVSVRCSTQSTHCATNCSFVWKWNKTVWQMTNIFLLASVLSVLLRFKASGFIFGNLQAFLRVFQTIFNFE